MHESCPDSPTSPIFVPGTPKFRRLSLPEEPLMDPSHLATNADVRPPRSILKSSNGTQSHDPYDSDGENLAVKGGSSTLYNIPSVLPPRSHLVPMKQPAFDLHWQLLPFDPRRSKPLLCFDILSPVDKIVFQDLGRRTKPSDAQLKKLAANGIMTKMVIAFERGPFFWEVDVKNARGITCRDVFEAIYKTFDEQLTLEEQGFVIDRQPVEEACLLRCGTAHGFFEAERSLGWKRVDVLCRQTAFLGLTQPRSGGGWVLNLGVPAKYPATWRPRLH